MEKKWVRDEREREAERVHFTIIIFAIIEKFSGTIPLSVAKTLKTTKVNFH